MKITTLIEDKLVDTGGLETEHGLSLYIEVDGKNILFDTGQSGKLIDNAERLDIDLKGLDYVMISHGHFDHSGGLKRLLEEINPNIGLYVGKGFFEDKYSIRDSGNYEYVGNPIDESFLKEKGIKIGYVDEDMINITENLMIFTNFHRDSQYENNNKTMFLKEDEEYKIDNFSDEISIGIKTDEGLVVLVGCSHPGIVNILETIEERTGMNIHTVIGGTHLIAENDDKINKVIDYIKEKNIEMVGACHCTGNHAETMLSQQLDGGFKRNSTGDILEF